ncbi:MAG: hypothetical protein ACRD3B_13500 [Candidatus Sulfotelmatobacter sp.]
MASPPRSQQQPSLRVVIPLKTKAERGYSEPWIARTVFELIDMGLVEAFRDEYNIVRYRPVQQA